MRNTTATVLALMTALTFAGCRRDEPRAPATEQPPPDVDAGHETHPVRDADDNISLAFHTIPETPPPGEETRLELTIRSDAPLMLDPIAGEVMHFFVVSRDMSWNEHVHPESASGSYAATVRFPAAGEYVVYSIFKPAGRAQAVNNWPVEVGSRRGPVAPLASSDRQTRAGHYAVDLRTEPVTPRIDQWTSLVFTISRRGQPVTNLTPTGTLGHIVILREGAVEFVYAHSTDGEAVGGVRGRAHVPATPSGANRHERHKGDTGPVVTFHTRFPKAGRYKIWAQFKAGDVTIEPDFTIDVAELSPPAFGSSNPRP